ncbi:MAG: glycoside hydrolase family 125 protein [Bacteroidetes bacterium]|nr:glycoside hydrolase family 125 protein [Bacteroidota bacterium]
MMKATQRPPVDKRAFVSEAVEARIREVKQSIANEELAWLFENCFPNTLDTTVRVGEADGKPDTFVITGDIDAMWLRDSSAQVWPYVPLAHGDAGLQRLIAGLIHRQARCILLDPYANAFNAGPTGSQWESDLTAMQPGLHERKYEIDSLCYPVRLAHGYWTSTRDASVFDAEWLNAMRAIVRTFREQQRKEGPGPYRFQRVTGVAYDTVPLSGYGNPSRPCGLVHSAFRPSDDACVFPFLIPSNVFAINALRQLADIVQTALRDKDFARSCTGLADEIEEAILNFGIVSHGSHGKIFAYEVDGFGNALCMDDANIPSLLSLTYLGCVPENDPVYDRTRRFVLSEDNPYFFRGTAGEGIGGPHVGLDMIWPMSVIMRAFTAKDDQEILQCLAQLTRTHGGTGFMHESFHKDDPARFTRAWFAWANTLFGELILTLHDRRPALLNAGLPNARHLTTQRGHRV